MELRQLRYFIGIVEAGSVTRAAQYLHIAQPALSAQIANLEAELGVLLLVRSVRGVTCTEAGYTFYKHAQQILRHCSQALAATRASGDDVSGTVSVGMPSSVVALAGVVLLRQIASAYPNIRLQLTDSPSAYLTELLLRGRLDIAILFAGEPLKGLVCKSLFTESLLFIQRAEPSSPAEILGDVPLAEVAPHQLVLPIHPNALRIQVDAAFATLGLKPHLFAEINSLSILAQVAASGIAATINSWSTVARELDAGLLTARRIVEPEITRTIAICHSDVAPLSGATGVVYSQIKTLIADLVQQGSWRGASRIDTEKQGYPPA